jgi:hypothetical protein
MSSELSRRYVRKPFPVDAVQVSLDNMYAVAKWCAGELLFAKRPKSVEPEPYVKVRVINPMHDRQTMAFVGDYVLYANNTFKVYTRRAFEMSFEAAPVVEVDDNYGEKIDETTKKDQVDIKNPFMTENVTVPI